MMYTIDEINDMLDNIVLGLPEGIFNKLTGGVNLLPDVRHPAADLGGLYTLGEYRHDQMGRYILIYYGSIRAAYPDAAPDEMRRRLREILCHELTHHLEDLAGERDLELEDERWLDDYKRGSLR